MRPDSAPKAFQKVNLEPGESTTVRLTLDKRSFAYWDPAQPEWPSLRDSQSETLPMMGGLERKIEPGWTVDPGTYDVVIGNSVADVASSAVVEIVD